MSRVIVAIDGTAGSGKSTVARLVASRLGLAHVDTGATYRLVGVLATEAGLPLDDADRVAALAASLDGACGLGVGGLTYRGSVLGDRIRSADASRAASIVAAHPSVRAVMVPLQRSLVPAEGAVIEGRDIGTVVWPEATVKVYLDARPDVRERRRASDPRAGTDTEDVTERDARDATRPVAPMRPAADAEIVDTSDLTPEEVVERVLALVPKTRRPRDLLYRSLRTVLLGLLRGPFRMEVRGKERVPRTGPVILAANHRSLIDIPVAAMVTRRKVWFMAKDELFRAKASAAILGRLGGFPVRRGRPDRSALHRSLELLRAGEVLGIFPEGTRRPDARFEDLEEGFAYLALKSGAPVVPVAISGTESVFPPGRKLPRPVKIRVVVGEPFRLGGGVAGVLPRSRIRAATDEARTRLVAAMREVEGP